MSDGLHVPTEWIAEDLASIRAPNKTTQADVHNLLERWEKEETAMKITLDISELEIKKVKAAMNELYFGEADFYFDWSKPDDVAQAVKDTITEMYVKERFI